MRRGRDLGECRGWKHKEKTVDRVIRTNFPIMFIHLFVSLHSVQSLSRVQPCDPIDCSTPGFPVHHHLSELAQTCGHHVCDAIQPSHPLSSPLPSLFPSIRVFSSELALWIRWPEYWSFSFSISPSNEYSYSGLISFRIDWFDLLTAKGLKRLLPHHGSKASILQRSAFFIAQLSHPYMTTGKTIALTRQIFVGKVRSLLFNMLSRLVITFFQGVSIF